ncbi:MAG: hypothetical protein JWN83_2572 [Chitinophagaceae bacterium]|nr:hypothetical protein [Chitinophagaceae bacterium]
MFIFLILYVNWITSILGIIISLITIFKIIPSIRKYLRQRKYTNASYKLIENERRQLEIQPNFVIQQSPIKKIIKFYNLGSKAFKLIFITVNFKSAVKLAPDKAEANKNEVVNLFLGDEFDSLKDNSFELSIGYADIDGRRYQQIYSRDGINEKVSPPQLLVDRWKSAPALKSE